MITEDYVSFEVAKLLKEKGFDWASRLWYNNNGIVSQKYIEPTNNILGKDEHFPCVTNQMAMKWLRKVHSLYISIKLYFTEKDFLFSYTIFEKCENLILCKKYEGCIDSYEEACEAAIKYCLENLI